MISEKTNPEEPESSKTGEGEREEKILLSSSAFENMDWWPGLSDVDRINILSSPLEDRARLLASKYSRELIETMREIGKKSELSYVEDFELPENPTKLLPLRMIHNYSCLPVGLDEDGRIELVAVWPPRRA